MLCDFRRVFQPTEEEMKQDELLFKKMWDEIKKKRSCVTCEYCIHVINYPDFVTGEECACTAGLKCDTVLDTTVNCKRYKEASKWRITEKQ